MAQGCGTAPERGMTSPFIFSGASGKEGSRPEKSTARTGKERQYAGTSLRPAPDRADDHARSS
jgi:hypothetical protein